MAPGVDGHLGHGASVRACAAHIGLGALAPRTPYEIKPHLPSNLPSNLSSNFLHGLSKAQIPYVYGLETPIWERERSMKRPFYRAA